MRNTRAVSAEEFQAFISSQELEQRRVGQLLCYIEPGDWPENLVASFLPASASRKRDMGWRIAFEPEPEPEEPPAEGEIDGEEIG